MPAKNYKPLLAAALVVVSAMCIEGFFGGSTLALTAARQGNSDTFGISFDFTAVDANGTAMAGAPIFCKYSAAGGSIGGISPGYASIGAVTDSQGKFHFTTSSTVDPSTCPNWSVTVTCYADKDGLKSSEAGDTVELACHVTPTATPIASTPIAALTPTATPEPAACGDTHAGVWPATCNGICSAAGKTCVRQSSCDGKCVDNPCGNSCGGTGDTNGCLCAPPTPTPADACGDTHAAVVSGSSDNTCSAICSSFGKTCVGMSSCGGNCISAPCSNHCGGTGDIAGCRCA